MGDSLKDQLLKLGLGRRPAANERKSSKQRSARRHEATPPRAKPDVARAAEARGMDRASQADNEQVKQAKESLRAQRQADRERSARQARAREHIEAHKLDDAAAEIKHYYSTGRKIKWLYVTETQQAALLRGEIVIAIAQGKGRLVPASLVPSLREIDPELRVVDPGSASETDGDPGHEIPDDLRW